MYIVVSIVGNVVIIPAIIALPGLCSIFQYDFQLLRGRAGNFQEINGMGENKHVTTVGGRTSFNLTM